MFAKYFKPGALFSYRPYRNLWASTVLTVGAISGFPIVLAVAVLDTGANATRLGLILAARIIAGVVLAPFAGVLVDRMPRKTALILADGFRAILGTVVVFLPYDSSKIWLLSLIVFVMGVSDAFGAPASQAIMGSVLPPEKLLEGNTIRGIAFRMGTVIGPGIAGLFVIALGVRGTFAIMSAFFLIGAGLLFRIDEAPREEKPEVQPNYFKELAAGFRVVWLHKWVAAMIAMATVQLMIVVGTEEVLLPVITKRVLHTSSVFATSAMLFSVGAGLSALIAMKYKAKRRGQYSVLLWGIFAIAPLVLIFPTHRWLVILGYFVAGFSVGGWEAYWWTGVQEEIPEEYLGRVSSIDYMGSVGLLPLGMALAGPLSQYFGERPFLIGVAIFHLAICALVLQVPGVRDMKSPHTLK
jgi:MFS family permease